MRYTLLLLAAVIGWSAEIQTPAPPPITVKLEIPQNNPLHFLEILMPGIVGVAGVLLGAWLTSRHNASENAENREHQLKLESIKVRIAAEAKSREKRWEFRKEVYVNLMSLCDTLRSGWGSVNLFQSIINRKDAGLQNAMKRLSAQLEDLAAAQSEFHKYSNLAVLALGDNILPVLAETQKALAEECILASPNLPAVVQRRCTALTRLVIELQSAAHKDLWGNSESEPKAKAAEQS